MTMQVIWSMHAKHRFAERAVLYGINYAEIELAIKAQKVKIKQEKNKYKTIFDIQKIMITAVKAETKEYIHVLTLWEANEAEVEIWKKK